MKINACIIDDEKLIADAFCLTFKKAFPDVLFTTFYSPEKLLEYSKINRIDLLICDIDMPIISGIKLAKMLKEANKELKILFLTGMNTFDYVYDASKLKDSRYVLKVEEDKIIIKMLAELIDDIEGKKNVIDEVHEIRENIKDLQEERISNDISHIFTYEVPLFKDTVVEDKELIVLRFKEKINKQLGKTIIKSIKKRFAIAEGMIFIYDLASIIVLLNKDNFNDKDVLLISNDISKEHDIKVSIIYTEKEYHMNEFYSVYNKINDIFLMMNIDNNFVECYENFIGNDANSNYKIIEQIKDYIWDHMEEDISLKKISDILFYNESYLSRLFKKLTGSKYKDFSTALKLEKAKYLLKNTDLLIKDICKKVGFESISHFQFFFKKHFGTTPLEYRRTIIK